jgi:DNA replication protein DnaC
VDRLFTSSGIPNSFRAYTFDSLDARVGDDPGKKPAIAAARLFAAQGFVDDPVSKRYKTGLVLSGPCGMAKTGLLTPVLHAFIERGKSAMWIEVYDLISEIQDGYSTGDSNKRLDAARTADIILLDDLGDADRAAPETDDRRRIIFLVINHRYNAGLPTLITTNLSGKQLADQFGARVFERIAESCLWLKMAGRNLRMEG